MPDRIKLALVNEGLAGGIRKHIFAIAKRINRQKFEPTIIFAKRPGYESEGDPAAELNAEGLPFVTLPMVREPSPLADLHSRKKLVEELRKHDVVHAHSAKAGFLARDVCRKLRKPCFYSPHVFPFQRTTALKTPIYLALERFAASWTTGFILNSESERQSAMDHGLTNSHSKLYLVPNAIDLPDSQFPEKSSKLRTAMGTPERAIVFITVGRLVPYKGIDHLIYAISKLKNKDAELWIVGEGEDASRLRSLSSNLGLGNRVRFLGYRNDVLAVLAASDCFVLASQNEGCPYTVLEALGMEKPIIATAVQGVVDLLKDPDHSRLVPWNDSSALERAMEDFVATPFSGVSIGSLPGEFFDVEGQIKQLENIYQGTI